MNNGNIAHHYFGTHLANYPWRIIKFVFCNKMDFATNTKSWISILSFLTFILLKDLQFMMSDSAAVHWLAGNSDFCNLYLQIYGWCLPSVWISTCNFSFRLFFDIVFQFYTSLSRSNTTNKLTSPNLCYLSSLALLIMSSKRCETTDN